ncbi:TonB-dependent receptor [Ferruginibacter sp. HRS2-29]|uniref:SusC/RagA family TonB-linked outer membrane protein n=1 Tax=Ferruginibacter sp. HRS2-29 TaxID=2487334 RepID=UPI0020CC2EDE|nr:TonB-dependent receptor [Ferruginibacter sp. HRS2-29]MCP9752678.1 TonB-dependent receptor [Ferruginibacter sp. HRS2-29]
MMKSTLLLLLVFLLSGSMAWAQTTTSGKITDSKSGAAISNASVIVKGTSSGTSTGQDGSFRIDIPSGGATLVISSLGYTSKEVSASGTTTNVTLDASGTKNLDEVVVVGFGTRIKKDLTGNIAKVKGSDVQNMPVTNLNQALQGRAAGVFVEANSGKVGEGVKVLIRGSGSISASNSPLYVIDGIPISNNSYSGSPISDINFNDVESFDILKDASAAAIYGSRAANGVVLITTKKGRSGKTNFQVNSQYGVNKPTHYRGFLNAPEYVALLREAAINSDNLDGIDPLDPAQYPDSWLEFAEGRLDRYSGWSDWRTNQTNTNWEKKAFDPDAMTSALDISASGGTDRTKYYLSLSYLNQDGILIGNRLKRLSSRINLEQAVSDKFKIGLNMSLSQTSAGRVQVDNEFATPMQIVALSPVTPFYDQDGNLSTLPVTTYNNPYIDYAEGKFKAVIYRNIGNIFGQYNFSRSLSFRTEFGVDIQNQNDDQFYGPNTTYGTGSNGYGESDWFRGLTYNTNNYFTFKKNFSQKHDLEAVAGMSFQDYNSEFANVYGEQFPNQQLQKLASAGLIKGGTSRESNSTFLSYFARANYKFNNRYLVTLSGRVDGSSVFGNDNRYGFFPAASLGWIVSEENFMQGQKLLSFLKLRGSWGLTGNADGFGDFASRGLWGGVAYNGTGGLASTQLANPDLKWEKSNQLDFGIDFGFFNNRISGEIDVYKRKTEDLIYSVPVPGNTGYSNKLVNLGAMENKGLEIVLNSDNVSTRNFKWSSNLNLAFNKNKITKLDGDQTLIAGNDGRYLNSLIVGESIGVFYGPKFAGADPANGDALYYLQDGKTTTNDYNAAGNFIVGNPNPKLIAGFGNSFSYKGFELNVLFQGVFGNQIQNGAGGFMSASFDWFDNQTRDQLDRWQKPGDITQVPQLRLGGGNGISASSRYVEDGDYVRLKSVTLAYNFPASLIRRAKLTSAKFYVTGVNLLTFTDYKGWDPEVNTDYRAGNRNQGSDFYAAPQIKNFSVGLNLGF